jgi:hypothetical protein
MQKNAASGHMHDNKCKDMRQYPLGLLVTLTSEILALMQQVVRGEELDDGIYARVFGNKDGLVNQLQRLCEVLTDIRAIDPEAPEAMTTPVMMSVQDSDVLRHYVMQLAAHYGKES